MPRSFVACKKKVHNRGVPPTSFLNESIEWARQAPDDIFTQNNRHDIYSSVREALGPYPDLLYRKAVMLEVLRVLAGFESSWNFNEGVDEGKNEDNTPETEEAGIFQCSCNALRYDESLQDLFKRVAGDNSDCNDFIAISKGNHGFAFEFCARLLRFTTGHHGPIKGNHIHKWLRRDAVAEFQRFLSE